MSNKLPSDEVFKQLMENAGKNLFESFVDSKNDRAGNILMLIVIAILAYSGVEAVKLTMRRNFGKDGVSNIRAILSGLAFLIIVGITYSNYNTGKLVKYGSQSSLLFTSGFYLVLAILVFYRGFSSINKDNPLTQYRGDSFVLGLMVRAGVKQSVVQNFYEPFLFLSLGMFFLPYSYLLGIPLIFCAVSVWAHFILESTIKKNGYVLSDLTSHMSNEGSNYSKNRNRSQILN